MAGSTAVEWRRSIFKTGEAMKEFHQLLQVERPFNSVYGKRMITIVMRRAAVESLAHHPQERKSKKGKSSPISPSGTGKRFYSW